MKTAVRQTYPYPLTTVLDKLQINPALLPRFLQFAPPPDYTNGRVRRYKELPYHVKELKCLVGEKAAEISIKPAFSVHVSTKVHFIGTDKECTEIIQEMLRQWWQLPLGKEIETIVKSYHPTSKNHEHTQE